MLLFIVYFVMTWMLMLFMLAPIVLVAHVILSLLKQRSYLAYGLVGVVGGPLVLDINVSRISLFTAPLEALLASAALAAATMLAFRFLMRTSTEKPDYWFYAPSVPKTENPTP